MDHQLLQRYEQGPQQLRAAIAGLSREDLLAFPIPGKWSTQQVVIHLLDAELAHVDRIKRVLATDNPTLLAWDETSFEKALHYEEWSADDAAQIFDLLRKNLTRVLRKVPTYCA